MDEQYLVDLYRQVLGREPDPAGFAHNLGLLQSGAISASDLAGAFAGSQEAQSSPSASPSAPPPPPPSAPSYDSSPAPSSAANEQYLRNLYKNVLGREPDAEGFASNLALLQSGAVNISEITNAFVTSPEAQQNSIPAAQEQKAAQGLLGGAGINVAERAKELADQVYGAYSSNVNYDAELNELNSLAAIDPEAFYKARINLLGKQMGWQVGQNTSGENVKYEAELNSLLAGAQQAGLSNEEVNKLVTTGADQANRENQERIAREAAKGQGWVNQNIPGGYLTLGALAAAIAAPYALSYFGAGAGAGAAGAAGAGTGLTGGAGAAGGLLSGGTVGGLSGAGTAAGLAGTQAAAGLGIAGGSALAGGLGAMGGGLSTVGSLSPALPAAGSVGGAGAGLSAQLAPGTILGTGLPGGGAIGASYMAGANNLPATNIFGNPIPASSVSFGGYPTDAGILSNLPNLSGLSDILKTPLGQLGANTGLSLLGGGAQQQQQPVPQMAGGSGTYAPRGQVDYRPIIDLLAPRQISRTSLLG
jgi:hypothetical protein